MQSYSDAQQDLVVLKLFNNQPGYYLDIGCSDGISRSNTYLLEQNGWNGILIDKNHNDLDRAQHNRKASQNIIVNFDVTQPLLIEKALEQYSCPQIIDYISLDVDECSLLCLQNFPLSRYRFKFLTFEHDIYAGRPDCIARKVESPRLLESFGYTKIVDNVIVNNLPYEDWYADLSFFDSDRFSTLMSRSGWKYQDILDQIG